MQDIRNNAINQNEFKEELESLQSQSISVDDFKNEIDLLK
jgi:hypothetical protein